MHQGHMTMSIIASLMSCVTIDYGIPCPQDRLRIIYLLALIFVMHIHLISLFPEIFDSFIQTSLVNKAVQSGQLEFSCINPRDFSDDRHQQVDDTPYGDGQGMLLQAEPIIRSIEHCLHTIWSDSYHIVMPAPSQEVFVQTDALSWSSLDHLIFVCGRYEGIDHRLDLRIDAYHANHRSRKSLGRFVLLGWEVAALTMIEATVRLVPWVIQKPTSRQLESYDPLESMTNIEAPQYTKPQTVRWLTVPDVLLSGDGQAIQRWRDEHSSSIHDH